MADEFVPASPLSYRAKKRKSNILRRRAKRRCINTSENSVDISKSSATEFTLPTIAEESASNLTADRTPIVQRTGNVITSNQPDIAALYWPASGSDMDDTGIQNIDIYKEARLLEEANRNLPNIRCRIDPNLTGGGFAPVSILSQCPIASPSKRRYEPSQNQVTDSELLGACDAADLINDIHRGLANFSQWESPAAIKSTSTAIRRPIVDIISNRNNRPSYGEAGPSCVRGTRNQGTDKTVRKRINFNYDSDGSKSSISVLSLQSDEAIECTPVKNVDFNTSQRIVDNLQDLGSFLSQSLVEDDFDTCTDDVFRYIMALKNQRKDVLMMNWFRSGKNFEVTDSISSKSFKGFPSENDVESSLLSKSEGCDIDELLEEDDDFFADIEQEETLDGSGKNTYQNSQSKVEVNSILESADRLLEQITSFTNDIPVEISQAAASTPRMSNMGKELNIDVLLNGKILSTPKLETNSENSVADMIFENWSQNVKLNSTITASDIEFDSEPIDSIINTSAGKEECSTALNGTFVIPKTPQLRGNNRRLNDEHFSSEKELHHPNDAASNVAEHAPKSAGKFTIDALETSKLKSNMAGVEFEAEILRPTPDSDFFSACGSTLRLTGPNVPIVPSGTFRQVSNGLATIAKSTFGGFQSAAGRTIAVSAAAQQRAEKFAAEFELNDSKEQNSPMMQGSSEMRASSRPKLDFHLNGISVQEEPLRVSATDTAKPKSAKPMFGGFQTASENSKISLLKAAKFQEEVEKTLPAKEVQSLSAMACAVQTAPKHAFAGYQTAFGNSIKISEAARLKTEKMMAEVEESDNTDKVECVEALPINEKDSLNSAKLPAMTGGFQSASRKSITVSEFALFRAKRIMDEENSKILTETTDEAVEHRKSMDRIKPSLHPAGVTPHRIQSHSNLVISPIVNSVTPLRNISNRNPSKNRLTLSRQKFRPPTVISGKSETPASPIPVHHLQRRRADTPNLQKFFDAVETSTPKNATRATRIRPIWTLSQEISASTAALLEDEAENGDVSVNGTTIGMRRISWSGCDDEKSVTISNSNEMVRKQREEKRTAQVQLVAAKKNFEGFVKEGILSKRKILVNRMNLAKLVVNAAVCSQLVNFSTALQHRFTVSSEDVAIPTEDGCFIVPDERNQIGFDEIVGAFLSLPSVSLALLPPRWTENHYKMILTKLSWLDAINRQGTTLTAENVCLQLKYRYDREIDRAQRSPLRKILEADDIPSKRMILVVQAIRRSDFGAYEIELSDRWYSIRTAIDAVMQDRIDAGKVKVGTKLMIQSAELLNCPEGCSPLEIPDHVRLKIHTNSTRRAQWYMKVGFYRVPRPFPVRIDQVRKEGGFVSLLKVAIVRVYPSVYRKAAGEKDDKTLSEFHSERIEHKLRQREEAELSNLQAIYSQVQREVEAEEKVALKPLAARKSIKDVQDPAELNECLLWEGDSGEIEAELSSDQRRLLEEYRNRLLTDRYNKIEKRVQSRLGNRTFQTNSIELLKLRIIDLQSPHKDAILSVWRPHLDVKSMLQERAIIHVTNVNPHKSYASTLQLTATTKSQFQLIRNISNPPILTPYFRHLTPIEAIHSASFKLPRFNELDTYGLVVSIGIIRPKSFQSVHFSDFDGNILCMNFWNSIQNSGYDDLIESNRFLACTNLQWRISSAKESIPTVYTIDSSVFTENPKDPNMAVALNALKQRFENIDLMEFAERCRERIREIKSRPVVRTFVANSSKSDSSVSSKSFGEGSSMEANNNSSIRKRLSNQEQIDRLKIYGNPPELPTMSVPRTRSVRKSFKSFSKVENFS